MDLGKIGKFISELRKEKDLTQEELAEKLLVTDRAVSKWERGLSLPDAGKMLDLCSILDINVNELLNGEKINMKDYNKKTEELLIELAKQEEKKNKRMMTDMWVILISTFTFYTAILIISANAFGESTTFGIITAVSTIIAVTAAFYALKLEVEAGYYECGKCHHRYKPTYFKALMAPHFSTTRYMKCPQCNKRAWAKKVMTRK